MKLLYMLAPNLERLWDELLKCIINTLQMLFISGTVAFFFGLFLGIILIVTKREAFYRIYGYTGSLTRQLI